MASDWGMANNKCTSANIKAWMVEYLTSIVPSFDPSCVILDNCCKINFTAIMKLLCKFDTASYMEIIGFTDATRHWEATNAKLVIYSLDRSPRILLHEKTFVSMDELIAILNSTVFNTVDNSTPDVQKSINDLINEIKNTKHKNQEKYPEIEKACVDRMRENTRQCIDIIFKKPEIEDIRRMNKITDLEQKLVEVFTQQIRDALATKYLQSSAEFDLLQTLKRIDMMLLSP